MAGRTARVIGTTSEAIRKAERELGFVFPPSFRTWLAESNGTNVNGIERIYPVFDKRDERKTWDSITRNFKENWRAWTENFEERDNAFAHLLPFAEVGDGDIYCFDYSRPDQDGEVAVVLWSHETGNIELCAPSFADFVSRAEAGDFDSD